MQRPVAPPPCLSELTTSGLLDYLGPEEASNLLATSRQLHPCNGFQLSTLDDLDDPFVPQLKKAMSEPGYNWNHARFILDSANSGVVVKFLKDLSERLQQKTTLGLYLKCLQQHGLKIMVQINDSESMDEFISQCQTILKKVDADVPPTLVPPTLVVSTLVVFALGRFKWVPNFERSDTDNNVLGRIEEISDDKEKKLCNQVKPGTLPDVNMSALPELRYIGTHAVIMRIGTVDLSGCANLHTIGAAAFLGAVGNVKLAGCTKLKTIRANAFHYAEGNLDFSGCTGLQTIGDGAFATSQPLGGGDLSGFPELQSIGAGAFGSLDGHISLIGCAKLETIGGEAFASARGVDLTGCVELHKIGRWAFSSVKYVVNLEDCKKLMPDWSPNGDIGLDEERTLDGTSIRTLYRPPGPEVLQERLRVNRDPFPFPWEAP